MNNQKLYEKMLSEQEKYRAWLLSQPPGEILSHAWEYIVRENILESIASRDLTDRQARALLNASSPLRDVCEDFLKKSSLRADIWEAMERRANRLIWQQRQRKPTERQVL